MGEKGPNKFEKEQMRKRNQQMRDDFDLSHLGNYRLVYPVLNNSVSDSVWCLFLRILSSAVINFLDV
jgi:hypothetical protein